MNYKYIYVFDYCQNEIFEIKLDNNDRKYITTDDVDVESILKRRGLYINSCDYMLANDKKEIEIIDIK